MKKYKSYIIIVIITIIICFINGNTKEKKLEFRYPSDTKRISSGFGMRYLGYVHFHNGIDFPIRMGSNIYAIEDGVVTYTNFRNAYGYTIIIKHDETYSSMYCHVDGNFIVSTGSLVSKGQVIAKVGPARLPSNANKYFIYNGVKSNGMTTGPHLHFSMLENNKYVNPQKYIK